MMPREATVAHLVGVRQVEFRCEPLPELGPVDLLCETLVSAISPGTELAAYCGLPPLRDTARFPRLVGYCNVARVVAAGANVGDGDVSVGDRVLTFQSHRSHFVIPTSDVLVRVPETAKAAEAACAYLFHLGYNAVLRSDVRAGSRVLVLGLGALGLTSVAMAAYTGAIVEAVSDHSLPAQIGTQFGASTVRTRAQVVQLLASADHALADVTILTTNGWADWELALKCTAQRGTVAVLGFPGRGQPLPEKNPLDSRHFYSKQLRVEAVGLSPEKRDGRGFSRFNERDNLAFLVNSIANGRLKARALVSGEYQWSELARAYENILLRSHSPITYILRWTSK